MNTHRNPWSGLELWGSQRFCGLRVPDGAQTDTSFTDGGQGDDLSKDGRKDRIIRGCKNIGNHIHNHQCHFHERAQYRNNVSNNVDLETYIDISNSWG